MVKGFGTWVSCRRCFRHSERLDSHAIDHAPDRLRCNGVGYMVSRAVPAALSDVLGRASGVSAFPVRCTPGTGGRSHHLKSAWSAVHRYRDELHVPQRGMVVFRHANPVILNLPPAVSDRAPFGTVVVFVSCVRHWILCT